MDIVIRSILYFFGVDKNPIDLPKSLSDADALRKDWENVGLDIKNAVYHYEQTR